MLLRLSHQASQTEQGVEPDNHICPGALTEITQSLLRKIFEEVTVFQNKLRMDFTRG